jgi:hypothetical protein
MTFAAAAIGGALGYGIGGTLAGAAIGAGIGGMIGGSANQAQAATQAAQTQLQGTQYAADIQKQMFDILNKQQEPYRQAGQVGLTQIQNMLPYFTKQPTAADIQGIPGYQFGLEQGLGSVSQAANVSSPGSNVDLARQKFSTDYLTQQLLPYYTNQQTNIYNRLASLAGLGQSATQATGTLGQAAGTNLAQLATGGANAIAGGQVGAANALAGGIGNITNAGLLYSMMNRAPTINIPTPGAATIAPDFLVG